MATSAARNFVNKGRFYLIFFKVENICQYFRVMVNSVFENFSFQENLREKDNFFKILKGPEFLSRGF